MTRRLLDIAMICTLLLLLLTACQAEESTAIPSIADTESATQTAKAYFSDLAALAATAASKDEPGIPLNVFIPTFTTPVEAPPPTQAAEQIPATIEPGPSPEPTQTSAPSQPSEPILPTDLQPVRFADCNRVEFVGDSLTPDGSSIPPGSPYQKTWRLKNAGTCPWAAEYQLVFVDGDQMQGQAVPIVDPIAPGEVVSLTVALTAPSEAGAYTGLWMLQGPWGRFGMGQTSQEPFWVKIQVPEQVASATPPPQAVSLNLAQGFCSAVWQTNLGPLDCPGNSDFPAGFAVTLDQPRLETRNENEIALYTHPPLVENGWISGTYPPFVVQPADRFLADVGCLVDLTGCQVEFGLAYLSAGSEPVILGQWQEIYDRHMTRLDVDLSSLAGQTIQLILIVRSQGDSGQAGAFWLVPQIRR